MNPRTAIGMHISSSPVPNLSIIKPNNLPGVVMLLLRSGSELLAANRSLLGFLFHWIPMQYAMRLVRTWFLVDEAELSAHITLSTLVSHAIHRALRIQIPRRTDQAEYKLM
jgi:hypothetical protein